VQGAVVSKQGDEREKERDDETEPRWGRRGDKSDVVMLDQNGTVSYAEAAY
jgi:hypothetical protein